MFCLQTPPSAKKLRVILPNSKFRQVWINIQLFVVLYIVWVTPVRVVSPTCNWAVAQLPSRDVCTQGANSMRTTTTAWPSPHLAHPLSLALLVTHTSHRVQGFNKPAAGFWFWVEGLIDLFFYTDLVLNFFTAYEVRAHMHGHAMLGGGAACMHAAG